MKTIVLCSSANFYEHTNQIAAELEKRGFKAVVPVTARKMQAAEDYDAAKHRTWLVDPQSYDRKTFLMREHFDEVAKGDAVLVVNDEKRGIKGYIGSNVLMEMGLAFYLKKPIFILNPVSDDMPVYEEVVGMGSVIIDGDLMKVQF
jgi:diphthamide synthase subunit DPH2